MELALNQISNITELFNYYVVIIAIIIAINYYVIHKLTFWYRQGIANDVSSIYDRFSDAFHLTDLKSHQKYGKIVGYYEGFRPALSIAEPELIKQILVTDFHKFANHRQIGSKQLLHESLFVSEYPEWKRYRTLFSPAFTSGKLRAMIPLCESPYKSLEELFMTYAKSGKRVNIRHLFDAFSMDVIARCSFGVTVDSLKDPNNSVMTAAKRIFQTDPTLEQIITFMFPKFAAKMNMKFFDNPTQVFFENLINQIIEERLKNNSEANDFLQIAIDQSELSHNRMDTKNAFKYLSKSEIGGNGMNFLLAGYETTASTLALAVYCLSKFPSEQENLIQEIDERVGNGVIDYDTLFDMKFLDAFVNETLRLLPSVARIERRCVNDCKLNNIFIPKDAVVTIPIWTVHRDPENFEDPDLFKPQRFMPENKHLIRPYSFVPFAMGPRNCIGMRFALMEVKYCLTKLLQKFRFESCDDKELEYFKAKQTVSAKNVIVVITER